MTPARGAIGSDFEASDGPIVHPEPVMGTVVSFHVSASAGERALGRAAVQASCRVLHEVDAIFSTWQPDSPLSRFRRGEVALGDLPPDVAHLFDEVFALCDRAKDMSGGWFDPWAMPGGVDPTGLVKGWAVDRVLDVLRRHGIRSALVNAGGDIGALGAPAPGEHWQVGIRHPWRPEALACVVRLDAAVATSGSYERGRHLVDPHRRLPTDGSASATVTGPTLALADALATALAVGGDDVLGRIERLDGYEGYLIRADGSEASTTSMPFVD